MGLPDPVATALGSDTDVTPFATLSLAFATPSLRFAAVSKAFEALSKALAAVSKHFGAFSNPFEGASKLFAKPYVAILTANKPANALISEEFPCVSVKQC